MALRSREQRDAAAAAMKARLTGKSAEPPVAIPAYVSAQTLAQKFDMSPDHAHKRFGKLPGVVNIGTGRRKAHWRYPMPEVLRELQGL
jgi:hypothetical protein